MSEDICGITNKGKVAKNEWENDDFSLSFIQCL